MLMLVNVKLLYYDNFVSDVFTWSIIFQIFVYLVQNHISFFFGFCFIVYLLCVTCVMCVGIVSYV